MLKDSESILVKFATASAEELVAPDPELVPEQMLFA